MAKLAAASGVVSDGCAVRAEIVSKTALVNAIAVAKLDHLFLLSCSTRIAVLLSQALLFFSPRDNVCTDVARDGWKGGGWSESDAISTSRSGMASERAREGMQTWMAVLKVAT